MLPILDYGGIAIVIPKVTAVGSVIEDDGKYGFEVYLTGMNDSLVISFETIEEATEARDELIAIIAQFYFTSEFGPDFDLNEIADISNDDDSDDDKSDKH